MTDKITNKVTLEGKSVAERIVTILIKQTISMQFTKAIGIHEYYTYRSVELCDYMSTTCEREHRPPTISRAMKLRSRYSVST